MGWSRLLQCVFSIIGLDVTGVVIVSGRERCCLFTLKGCGSSYVTLKRDLFLFLLMDVSVIWVQCLWRPGESDRALGTEVTAASAGTWTQVLGRVEHAIDLPVISPAPSFFPLLFYETLQGPGIILMVGRLWWLVLCFCLWLKHNAVLGCHMFGIQEQYRIHLKLDWDFQVGIIQVIYPNLFFKVNPFHNIV